ncbi:prepilin-type N-terminal cleavage/methylation domain-containing protein [Candidatus Parcubacteria bacterium]|nr:prepilin-type N-terminal cleavage/methylation domain-containing protein [Candidatus Parcubacteria bacterium]
MSSRYNNKGFTLAEVLVALAIFGFVVIMGSGTLVAVSNTNYSAQVSRKTIDNIDFILDDIVREARFGKDYHCEITETINDATPKDCDKGHQSFALTRLDNGYIVRYATSSISQPDGSKRSALMKQVIDPNNPAHLDPNHPDYPKAIQISADNIDIKHLRFYVSGSGVSDGLPAQVLVSIQAELKKGSKYQTSINLQTTIAQRASDN